MYLKPLLICYFLFACDGPKAMGQKEHATQLTLLSSRQVDINEPSGLTIDAAGKVLWMVGNNPERIYKLTVDGQVVDTLVYAGHDLEGIAYDASDSTLWVVEEERREVIHLDLDGIVVKRKKIGLDGSSNNGLEGICLDAEGKLYVLNEKDPGLFIGLGADLSVQGQYPLDFAKDYSGLAYDRLQDRFWVLSHQDSTLYLWRDGQGVVGSYDIPFAKVEGITVDNASKRVYIVSETERTLYIYALSFDP